MNEMECINQSSKCKGITELRMALSGTGIPYPRCEYHWDKRLRLQDEIDNRYPYNAPSDFDPGYAGERWDDEY